MNAVFDAKCVSILDSVSDLTAIFFLIGIVLSNIPSKREFILETGSWSTEVRVHYNSS